MNTPLEERLCREKEFHNTWARSLDIDKLLVKENFEASTAIENRYALSQLGDIKGKKLLDLGCGAGETSVYFALQGAEVTGTDIADDFLNVAQKLAAKHKTTIQTIVTPAESLPFEDKSFDCVFGNGILHHVDVLAAGREIERVLKPGGIAVFIEPLPYNPFIQIYRLLAKDVRTKEEKPLNAQVLKDFQFLFPHYQHQEFWFMTLGIFFYFFLVKRWHPSKVRYWKKVIEDAPSFEKGFNVLKKADDFLLKYLPFVRPLCWNTVIVVGK